MSDSPLGTIKKLVDACIEETDDTGVHYKLRTASQLVDVIQYHNDDLLETLENADTDDELEERLREMGYME